MARKEPMKMYDNVFPPLKKYIYYGQGKKKIKNREISKNKIFL